MAKRLNMSSFSTTLLSLQVLCITLTVACSEGLPGENLFSRKRTWQRSLGFQNCNQTNPKTSGTMSFGQTIPKWRGLAIMHSAMFWEKQTQHISTNTSNQLSSTVVEGA